MEKSYDRKADAISIRLKGKVFDSEEICDDVILDFNKQDTVVGVEILNVSRIIGDKVQMSFNNNSATDRATF